MRSRSNMTKMLVCHLAWSLSLIFRTYLPALVQSAKKHCAIKKKLRTAPKTVERELQLLPDVCCQAYLYKRSREGPHWMLTVFLPLCFVATALCKSSNWRSAKSEGVWVRWQAGALTGRLTILVWQTMSHALTEETLANYQSACLPACLLCPDHLSSYSLATCSSTAFLSILRH